MINNKGATLQLQNFERFPLVVKFCHLIAFFVLRGHAHQSPDFITNDINNYKTNWYLTFYIKFLINLTRILKILLPKLRKLEPDIGNKESVKYEKRQIKLLSKRVTVMIEDELDKKIRAYQAKKIQKDNTSYSYSKAVNDILKKGI